MAVCAVALAGCVDTVDGRSELGVPFVKDKVVGRYNRTVPQVFASSRQVLESHGKLISENTINHSLEAKVRNSSVFVRVTEIDPNAPVTEVAVQVRTASGGTDIDLAHEVEKEIALGLVR